MRYRLIAFIGLLFFGWVAPVHGTHIVGAELSYECLGGNDYQFELKMYRDCLNGQAGFDNPLYLFIFTGSGALYTTHTINSLQSAVELIPENWDACVGSPQGFCVQEGIYRTIINLPPRADGYDVAWARCCRSGIVSNLAQPFCEGVTFLAHVPGAALATCNSMPSFDESPPLFLCAGETFNFDYSATDPDGDSLVYELSHPYNGQDMFGAGVGNSQGGCGPGQPPPTINPNGNQMGPPPYALVNFANGHSAANPLGPGSFMSINPNTGFLSAFPANPGVYVLAVSVKEYRNGVLLSENKRDFQFYVINCLPQNPPPVLTHDLGGLNTNGDTIFVEAGESFCYDFTVEDQTSPSTLEITPLSVSFGGNGGFPPPYATITTSGTNPPVTGTICWAPACDYIGEAVPMIISARDTNDCPNYNIVFDTIWVVVEPPVNAPPPVVHDLSQAPASIGDTIYVDVQTPYCFEFMVIDTIGGASLGAENILMDSAGTVLGQVQGVTTNVVGDTLFGEVCWESFCNYDFLYMFVTNGYDLNQCPPDNFSSDTIWVRVSRPYNPTPEIDSDINMNPTVGDTIIANVHDEFCFDFYIADTSISAGQGLQFDFDIYDISGGPAGGEVPSYFATTNGDSVIGNVCWTPRCINNERLFMIVLEGTQFNECMIMGMSYDTVYVRVVEPVKPPPLISHNLGATFPDNLNIDLADDEDFCFDFMLLDTVGPSFVDYYTEVYFSNGTPFTGSLPDVLITNRVDTLIEGEICWTVPCELADQSFKIRMIGTDTFDCFSGNTVYDSVFVNHTENPPSPVELCVATVELGDSAVLLRWLPNGESDGSGYLIERQREDEGTWTTLDTFWSYQDTVYMDPTVQADDYSYCYSVSAIDRCGLISDRSNGMCTILLTGSRDEFTSDLNWGPHQGWLGGPLAYDIFRNSPVEGSPEMLLVTLNSLTLQYYDREVDAPRLCYRTRAQAPNGQCGEESWSNEVCVEFPATLYVPNAFSPNGDGLNEIFSSFGEFEESFSMQIYDRWGKLLFATTDRRSGWDGKVGGQPQPEGVYVYRILAKGFDGKELRANGSVTLIR